ncbi:ABC transporter permease [Micromonosporaceae bacterium DT55]|uniref:ABC transporter permease n=1 Tax=Melissospora conviva TaxID=3388432 RepID=UPI003C29E93A
MRALVFAGRNGKELLRDPLSPLLMIGLPLVLLFLLSAINDNVPNEAFAIGLFGPGIAVLSLSFITIFTGTLLAGDRRSSFLTRLRASPLTAADSIAGYTLPMTLIAVAQSAICLIAAFFVGLPVTANVLVALLVLVPVGVLFVGFGLLLGAVFTVEQVGGVGSILINAATLLSGTWFPLSLIGGTFETIANLLPFVHAVEATRLAVAGDFGAVVPHLLWCLGYALPVFAGAIALFRRQSQA